MEEYTSMKIFLDTADTALIQKHFGTGLIDGVTTNPTLIMKSGRKPEDVYQDIKDIGATKPKAMSKDIADIVSKIQ